MATPTMLFSQSPVTKKLTTSPLPSITNSATANHHAHCLRRSRPRAADAVATPSTNKNTPDILPIERNSAATGLLSSHRRSISRVGNNREIPTTAAITVATNRNAATIGTALGRRSSASAISLVAWLPLAVRFSRRRFTAGLWRLHQQHCHVRNGGVVGSYAFRSFGFDTNL